MAISFSRPDPASPSAVGSASFTSSRRGFDQGEVREFLRMVAAELARLQERERFLESELRELQTRGLSAPGRLDEETVTTILGEEAARVLAAARDAAVEIRERAEDSATRLVKEAVEDASRIKDAAREEASRIREDANGDIESEIELAKQQGRDLVLEAREYREKMLAELTRRRDAAKAQIDKLVHERDRLVGAFQRAKMSADEALAFLRSAHDDDEEYIFDFSRPPGDADTGKRGDKTAAAQRTASESSSMGFAIFDYTKDIERAAAEEATTGDRAESAAGMTGAPAATKPRGMPELPKRPSFLDPPEESMKEDAFGPIELHPRDVEVVDDEEPLEQTDTTGTIISPLGPDDTIADDVVIESGADIEGEVADFTDETDDETSGHLAPVVSLFGDRRRPDRESISRQDDARAHHPVTAGPLEQEPEAIEATTETPPPPTSTETPETTEPPATTEPSSPSRVDEIFAKLRAGSTASVTTAARAAVQLLEPDTLPDTLPDTVPEARARPKTKTSTAPAQSAVAPFAPMKDPKRLAKRAAALAPIVAEIDTHLKRALADDLNEVLQRLSNKRAALSVDNAMGRSEEHVARLATVLSNDFRTAATEGAKSMKAAGGSVRRINGSALQEALERAVLSFVAADLRAAVEAAIASADGDRGRVTEGARVAYRDARSRIPGIASDIAHEAHSAGAFMSLEAGTPVCWVVDPDGPACADGEDNSLAGHVACGQSFPTGDKRPLAHAGCRCLLGPAQH